ncbi:MAG: HPr(Ser) kinase/phosphatase [Xanthomonadaceae bacterium]|nr:HPr(Ser) kinase/phosphatase [Xanthomonadaceae bacterium]MDE2256827.1 HPr(Ser) kinase/phosphatase [Xanthomonadaceae bacterium]
MERLTARELFDKISQRLTLRWVAGQRGEHRAIVPAEKQPRRPSLAGYLNIIYPNKIQIVGAEELAWLDSLDSRQRWEMVEKIMGFAPTALIVTKDQAVPADLRDAANESGTPVWVSSQRGHELLTYLQYHLARMLARRVTLHGVLMEVYSIGVLIAGESGSGKSELALELITRGHRLVADDAPEFIQIAPDVIDGTCPEMLQDLLEVRGLGILNVREMFGQTAVKQSKYLRLVVHLDLLPREQPIEQSGLERIYGANSYREILDTKIPQTTIPVAPGRNLAVLVEAAVRNHVLKTKGIDPAQTFLDRQAHQMRRQAPW